MQATERNMEVSICDRNVSGEKLVGIVAWQ